MDNAQPGAQIQAPNINTDVKRDLSAGSIVLFVLTGLCVLGIAMALFAVRSSESHESGIQIFVSVALLFAVLDVTVSIAIIRGLVRWGIAGIRTPSVGRVSGIILLSLGTIVAVVIFFFFTCFFLAKHSNL